MPVGDRIPGKMPSGGFRPSEKRASPRLRRSLCGNRNRARTKDRRYERCSRAAFRRARDPYFSASVDPCRSQVYPLRLLARYHPVSLSVLSVSCDLSLPGIPTIPDHAKVRVGRDQRTYSNIILLFLHSVKSRNEKQTLASLFSFTIRDSIVTPRSPPAGSSDGAPSS